MIPPHVSVVRIWACCWAYCWWKGRQWQDRTPNIHSFLAPHRNASAASRPFFLNASWASSDACRMITGRAMALQWSMNPFGSSPWVWYVTCTFALVQLVFVMERSSEWRDFCSCGCCPIPRLEGHRGEF